MSSSSHGPPRPRRTRFRIRYALMALAGVILLGTICFHLIEGWGLADSLYVTVQTVTTVGYGDIPPKTAAGRWFATIFMITGVGTVAYALSSAVRSIVQSELIGALGQRRRHREMSRLRDHFIICGAGRVGSHIIRDIERDGAPFVVIETNTQKTAALAERGVHVLNLDATLDESLHAAGVERARGLVACLPDDADNVYVVLTARGLNPALQIVARAVEEEAEPKLLRAGANRVVAPNLIGSHRMAQALLKPVVHDFIHSITTESLDVDLEQIGVSPSSTLVGRKLRATPIGSQMRIVILSIQRANGEMIFDLSGETTIAAGDMLIAIGRPEALAQLETMATGKPGENESLS